jgi:hypothetical protein
MRRIASVIIVGALAFACADESLNPQPLPPESDKSRSPTANGGASAAQCTGTCCDKPAPGTSCEGADASDTCTWAVTCPTGLVLGYEVTCTSGTWQVTVDCPKDGETDARGCPSRQPDNDAPCDLTTSSNGIQTQCGYVLQCTGYRKSALATCSANKWQTTPLGTCD